MAMNNSDGYLMARGLAPSNRLVSQHFLWKDELGFSLHPAAKEKWSPDEPRRVADIATGNGIWILEEARHLPPGSKAYGFDVSPLQFPPSDTVPENVTLQILDIKGTIPPEFKDSFDVVHVRLIIAAVGDNDPLPILKNLVSMLKPGGFLQWSEVSPAIAVRGKSDDPAHTPAADKVFRAGMQLLSRKHIPDEEFWVLHLGEFFEKAGLEGVKNVKAGIDGVPRQELWKYWNDNAYGAITEIAVGSGAGMEYLDEMASERERGQYFWYEPWVTLGQKPISTNSHS